MPRFDRDLVSSATTAESERSRAGIGGSRLTLVDAVGDVLAAPERGDIETRLRDGTFFWLDLHQPTAATSRCSARSSAFIRWRSRTRRDFGQRPKIEPYDDYAFLVVYGAAGDDDGLVEVHCFSAEHYLVTVRHDDCPAFVELQRALHGAPGARSATSRCCSTTSSTASPTASFRRSRSLDDRIDTLQAEIFANPREEQLQEVFAMKQRLVGVRRVITPQRDMFAQLVGSVVDLPGTSDETTRYFRDVYDHLIRLSDMIDSYRDLLSGVDRHLPLDGRQSPRSDHEAADGAGVDLPADHLHHRLLRPELRLHGPVTSPRRRPL